MTTRGGSGGDDCEGDADGESPADLEDVAEGSDTQGVFQVQGEGCDGGDAREAVRASAGVFV